MANDAGDRTTPAYVGINDGEVLVGLSAKQLCGRKPASVVKHNKKVLSLSDQDVSTLWLFTHINIGYFPPPHLPS